MKIPQAEFNAALEHARQSHNGVPLTELGDPSRGTIVYYAWGLASADGAWYQLLKEPHHDDRDIARARATLRNCHDVVRMEIVSAA